MVLPFFSESKALKALNMEVVLNSRRVANYRPEPLLAKTHPFAQKDQLNFIV
jgi:hypothetical protein